MKGASLISSQNHVETPFIIVKIGNYTFGHCSKPDKILFQKTFNIEYPNYMDSLNITKINGTVNTYVLTMTYAITESDDPNRLEKVFSSISKSRLIKLSYGDWNAPSFIYKEEEAIITKLVTRVDVTSSKIQYVINCTSSSAIGASTLFNFNAKRVKPSDELKRLISDKGYGLLNLFPGMRNYDVTEFIDGSDREVQLEAKPSCGIFEYISYLVSCMTWVGESSEGLKSSCYFWSVYDDVSNKYGGTYFKVVRVDSNSHTDLSYNTYEVDVGFPTDKNVMRFSVDNDDSWSLLYDYSNNVELPKYSYQIDDSGYLVKKTTSPALLSRQTHDVNEVTRDWWSKVTNFPIKATLELKGLLRPAMLMTYVKVNTYFYGHKHISSGLYIITKQVDSITSQGYRTTLSLLRLSGDEYYT